MRYYKKIDGKLSPDDVESIVQRTIATQALEGSHMTEEEIDKLRAYVSGQITDDEYTEWAIGYAKRCAS